MNKSDPIAIITCGGTIDKVYFDDASQFTVGEPEIGQVLERSNVTVPYTIQPLLQKDSLHMTGEDRELIISAVAKRPESRILITHGTDTMVLTAQKLKEVPHKTIVLTGSLQPAKFHVTDALFNIGAAFTAVQTLDPGVYIIMNGAILDPDNAKKNSDKKLFEEL